jgi:hypothetical protein
MSGNQSPTKIYCKVCFGSFWLFHSWQTMRLRLRCGNLQCMVRCRCNIRETRHRQDAAANTSEPIFTARYWVNRLDAKMVVYSHQLQALIFWMAPAVATGLLGAVSHLGAAKGCWRPWYHAGVCFSGSAPSPSRSLRQAADVYFFRVGLKGAPRRLSWTDHSPTVITI